MIEIFKRAYQRLLCVGRGHAWKRAVRLQGNLGYEACRHCGTERYVTLRNPAPPKTGSRRLSQTALPALAGSALSGNTGDVSPRS
jgi:hypothetical protein